MGVDFLCRTYGAFLTPVIFFLPNCRLSEALRCLKSLDLMTQKRRRCGSLVVKMCVKV
jgi:hypothetical protein